MIRTLREGLLADGVAMPPTKLCARFGVSRCAVCCKPARAPPKVAPRFAEPIGKRIEDDPSFGYRTVAHRLGFNRNTVRRNFRLRGWQVWKRPVGARPRIAAMPSVAAAPNERRSTAPCRVWTGKDRWARLALVVDRHTREGLGWHLSHSGKATTAAPALEHALIARFGTLGRVGTPFLLRADNGLVCTSRHDTRLVRRCGLKQAFITPHCPQQNGMMERLIRSLEEQCVHQQRFESLTHATRAIGDWIQFCNTRRPHRALGIRTPAEVGLAA
ncbi:IS3 family transposase [Paralimibaculum aggregatum]|uniref:IS3 family transposase n=1 Tax=Paralimibaculum aggregatum TaxID=3036245 RepID=A0ABQ6LQD6_9RHOB|nr:integrase core domain-containing protein [Limibaculum sp. NKW23]GMG84956.1 IS3 family transposase [Limibaculum sp. NKW23]